MRAEEFNNRLARIVEAFIAKAEEEDESNVNTTYIQVTNNPQENGTNYVINLNVSITWSDEEDSE